MKTSKLLILFTPLQSLKLYLCPSKIILNAINTKNIFNLPSPTLLASAVFLCMLTACGGNETASSSQTTQKSAPPLSASPQNSDTINFPEVRNNYSITYNAPNLIVTHNITKNSSTYLNVKHVQFSDVSVNLLVTQNAKTISSKDLDTLIDLYIAFFNRAPDADGLNYWIDNIKAGMTLEQIAANFYLVAKEYPNLTGYDATMNDDAFVRLIYKNVLGRIGTTAPPDSHVEYWVKDLQNGLSKEKLVSIMLVAAREYAQDKEWSWMTTLLNNKVALSKYFALEQGLTYNTYEDSIRNTMKLTAAITPTDYSYAINLLDIKDSSFNLNIDTTTPKQAQIIINSPSNSKIQWNLPTKDASFTLKDLSGTTIPALSLTCATKNSKNILISSNCKVITGLRLGKQEIVVSGGGYTATATVTVTPQFKTLTSQGASDNYHFTVTQQGNLLAWGYGTSSALGQGSNSQDSYLPIYVKNQDGTDKLANIVSASVGDNHPLALTEDGQVLYWGGSNNPKLPTYVRNAANNGNLKNIVQVSAGDSNFAALADDGTVYTWGYWHGQGSDGPSQYPNQVINPTNTGALSNIISISAGGNFTLALSADGKVYAWGWNSNGNTGRGTESNPVNTPMAVQLASDQSDLNNIIAISAGYRFSLALASDGKVYAWGDNSYGQIGQNVQYKTWSRAVPVMSTNGSGQLSNINMVAAGGGHALVMDNDGKLYSWGRATSGQLGDGANRPAGNERLYPHSVVNAAGVSQLSGVISIAAGDDNSLAVMSDGSLLIWGQGYFGANAQGASDTKQKSVPTLVKDMTGTGFLSVGPVSTYQNWLHRGR